MARPGNPGPLLRAAAPRRKTPVGEGRSDPEPMDALLRPPGDAAVKTLLIEETDNTLTNTYTYNTDTTHTPSYTHIHTHTDLHLLTNPP